MQLSSKLKITSYLVITLMAVFAISTSLVFSATTPNPLSSEIKELDNSIKQKKAELDSIKKQQDGYKRLIQQKQSERSSLINQLEIVQNRTAETELSLAQAKIDIETTNLEIQKTNLEILDQDKKISDNKSNLGTAIKLLSQEDGKSQLEILLLNNYLTDYLSQVKYLENINDKISDNLSDLRVTKDRLGTSREKLTANSEKLKQLRAELETTQVALANEKNTKGFLIDQTKNSESEYQKLLADAKQEQSSAASDILSLERTLRDKVNAAGKDKITLTSSSFIWPVPSQSISAYFHDPTYPFRNIFEHPAVDIRAPQGTPVKAVASGYVGRAKDGGLGYSYIMLIHADGLSTVYGHISRIYVKDDEYVTQGQIIGLSGAMPGTPGAGSLTTGPHLHFETRLNGIPVDPLNYLP
jgi:murein DD-endopeptidase MepM/ murein hydrolase activator NlpD